MKILKPYSPHYRAVERINSQEVIGDETLFDMFFYKNQAEKEQQRKAEYKRIMKETRMQVREGIERASELCQEVYFGKDPMNSYDQARGIINRAKIKVQKLPLLRRLLLKSEIAALEFRLDEAIDKR